MPYGNLIFSEGRDCPICLEKFAPEDKVVQLKCHIAHIYHE
jgi:hypothetical protein